MKNTGIILTCVGGISVLLGYLLLWPLFMVGLILVGIGVVLIIIGVL